MTGRLVTVRLLTAADDLEPELDLAARAFGPMPAGERERRLASSRATVAAGRHIGAFDGPAMVASARWFDMRQWWHGRSLPMAGVASVKVAPEERGRGVGRALVTGLLDEIAEQGYPLSVLYPATRPVYRSAGWEMAGGQYDVTIPAHSLRALQAPDPLVPGGVTGETAVTAVRRSGPADVAEINALADRLHAGALDCGPSVYDEPTLAALLDDPDIYCYLAPDGELTYRWDRSSDQVLIYRLIGGSAATLRTLWGIVASHGTMVSRVRAFVGPADPVSWLLRDPEITTSRREMWMLRVVDAPAAIAGRGYPAGAAASVPVDVHDEQRPANSGSWQLEIGGGKGGLTRRPAGAAPGGTAALRLGIRGLAALYAGTPLATLRAAGLAAGGDAAADAALDEAFAGAAYMFDYF